MRKEKNFVIVEVDGKERKFDLNARQWLSLKGDKYIQSKPVGIGKAIQPLSFKFAEHPLLFTLRKMWCNSYYCYLNKPAILELLDKVESLNLNVHIRGYDNEKTCEFVLQHFKLFVKEVKKCEKEEVFSLRQFCKDYQKSEWISQYTQGIQATEEEKDFLFRHFCNTEFSSHCSRILWHLRNNRVIEGIQKIDKYNCSYDEDKYFAGTIILIKYICRYANKLEIKIPKGDLSTVYIQLMETAKLKEMQEKDEAIKTNQMGKGLEFVFGNYVAVVPFTAEEFLNEADQQGNCVYRIYKDRVANGLTNIVFIRHKDDLKKSVVTCEVNNGVIWQYLAKHNNSVNNQELLDFKEKYQEHLDKIL